MIQDRAQKAQVLRHIVAKRWLPQLEVDVLPKIAMSYAEKRVTDIDALALIPDEFEGYRVLLVDCKTRKNESPITRALWQRGVMDQLHATRGICILKRNQIEQDHRFTAAQLGILLLTESEFSHYSVATGADKKEEPLGHVAKIDLWEEFFNIPSRFPILKPAINFSRSGYWKCKTEAEACRKTIAGIISLAPELDPVKHAHLAVVADLVTLFMHATAKLVSKIFASYLQPERREDLSAALLFLLYGGRESYEFYNTLRKLLISPRDTAKGSSSIPVPEWDSFIQLTRHCLDAPSEVSKAPLLIREVAWQYLEPQRDLQGLDFAKILAAESPQAAKLALLGTEYLCRAAKLPPEFGSTLSKVFLDLQPTPRQ